MWWVELLNSIVSVLDSGGAGGGAGAFESIATASLNGVQTVTLSSIPSTYSSLHLRIIGFASVGEFRMRFNGDSGSNYARHTLNGYNSAVSAAGVASTGSMTVCIDGGARASLNTTYPTVALIDVHNYASTTQNKTVRFFGGTDQNSAANSEIDINSGLWLSTAAVNSITIFNLNASNFTSGSFVSLYGIKG